MDRYLNREDEEMMGLKTARRPGRPSSTREDLLKQKMAVEEKEYMTGFWIPDMQDSDNLAQLLVWNGEWGSLNTIKFVRLPRNGTAKSSNFPPKGQS